MSRRAASRPVAPLVSLPNWAHTRARAQTRVLVRCARQDFGNFQDLEVMRRCYEERRRFGRIWYRFPSGEAGSDVYSRVGDLWGALRRRIDHPRDRPHRNLVLVTHGLLMRFFCMHYLGWTEHEFEQVWSHSKYGGYTTMAN